MSEGDDSLFGGIVGSGGSGMLHDDVQLISVDDHVIEHERVWLDRLPAKYLEAGPHIVDLDGGKQAWQFEDRIIPTIGLNAVAGKDPKDFGVDPVSFDEMLPGCYEVKARLADMDLDGVHAQMCFPSFPGFAGGTLFAAEDKELATACVVAWNDFILDEWSAAAPDRFIPMVMVPFWDVHGIGGGGRAHRRQGRQGHHLHRSAPPPGPPLVPQ